MDARRYRLVDYRLSSYPSRNCGPAVVVRPRISVIVLAKNEEANIAACLKSVEWADERVVIDSGSSDLTRQLAEALNACVVERDLRDFADQRNYADEIAKGEWLLHLDADERMTPELRDELIEAAAHGRVSGMLIPTLNNVFGAPLRHGGWYPQLHLRFFRRGSAVWIGAVHERVVIDGAVGTARHPVLHYGHRDVRSFIGKLNAYTDVEPARATSFARLASMAVFEPPIIFVYKYLLRGGFRDGWRGLAAALLLSFYRSVTHLKAIERLHATVRKT